MCVILLDIFDGKFSICSLLLACSTFFCCSFFSLACLRPFVLMVALHGMDRVYDQASKSRLAVVWQSTSKADLFCADELAAMQVG